MNYTFNYIRVPVYEKKFPDQIQYKLHNIKVMA